MRLYKRSGVVYSSRSRANIQLARRVANNAEKHAGMALCLCIASISGPTFSSEDGSEFKVLSRTSHTALLMCKSIIKMCVII